MIKAKEKTTKEKILKALEEPRLKKSKFKVTRKMQEEMNEVRKKLGFKPEPIKPEYDLEFYYG